MEAPAPTRFIRPDILARISNLELLARGVVEGFVAGLHRSPYKGLSTDFVEYRPYIPGDDLMHVDWKLYARTDRYYVKEYEDETNMRLALLVDVSRSMDYASGAVSKRTYASYLAAALAHLALGQRDAVGLMCFDDDVRTYIPPRSARTHLHALLAALGDETPGAATDFGKPLHLLAERIPRRGLVILFSDLFDDPASIADGLRHFRFRGHEVVVFHLLDPAEARFEFEDMVEFEDLETGERVLVEAEAAREHYLAELERFTEAVRSACGALGADYHRIVTDQPLDFALFEYLAARARRKPR